MIVRFIVVALGGAFLSALLLLIYEYAKASGYDRRNERSIIILAIIAGFLVAAVSVGILPLHGPFGN